MASPKEVASWMANKLEKDICLYQSIVVYEILNEFGEDHTYLNKNGNLAISKAVLKEFRLLTKENVVWDRSQRYWRFREDFDEANQRQIR